MSDIVADLRRLAALQGDAVEGVRMNEAAAEIARLRAELDCGCGLSGCRNTRRKCMACVLIDRDAELAEANKRLERAMTQLGHAEKELEGYSDVDAIIARANSAESSHDAAVARAGRYEEALRVIADYDITSKFGTGICPHGCDTPSIARAAIDETEAMRGGA